MVLLALDAVTSFSTLPLRFASYLGFGFGVVGIVLLGYTIVGLFLERTVTGWASLMTTIVVLGSVQLVMLGIFGEYFARFYLEAKRRPLFVIDKIVVSADLAPTQEHRLERVTL
jgi:dolichol-phosphate mannosyltransferase